MEERNHPASDRKRDKFREEGQIAKSRDLMAFGALLGSLIGLAVSLTSSTRELVNLMTIAFLSVENEGTGVMARSMQAFMLAVGPVLLGSTVFSLGLGVAETKGPLWVPPKLDLTRLDPLPRLTSLFGSKDGLINLGLSILKITAVMGATGLLLHEQVISLVAPAPASLSARLMSGRELVASILERGVALLLFLGVADYAARWLMLERKMQMSHDELRDEQKEDSGDPSVRARRRQRARQLAMARSTKDVPTADVVVVNPTHFAVALKYVGGKMRAPRVVAKGVDENAVQIRRIATTAGVPIQSEPPLARALFARVAVGREVPPDLYQAVAVVLATVYRMRGKTA
ncbi:MAG: EscU/YscU/HrcU family type III secretion system export apparatus switch protein [Deltaproteobacteria bacterium]|nr:EscU/YscU/HrcU family type III secretion system export apparatus switch protein [Deltaproteobacteria bacterium]